MKRFTILKCLLLIMIGLFLYLIIKNPSNRIYNINMIETVGSGALVEDFNGKLDAKYWNTTDEEKNTNNALQYYHPNNIIVKDGFLNIEAKKEKYKNQDYTSGQVTTKGKFEFLYGKIIFKARPAIGQGLLSAIWLLPADDSLLPEIDAIEVLGSKNNEIWTGVHYLDSTSQRQSNFVTYINNSDFSIYEFDWEKDEIRGYINNQLVFKTNIGVSNKKMYLIIDLAVGGDWPKNPDDNILPTSFLLDYIIVIPKELDKP